MMRTSKLLRRLGPNRVLTPNSGFGRGRCDLASSSVGRYAVMTVCAAALIGPFVWMVLASLKTDADIKTLPPSVIPNPITGQNYSRVLDAFPFWRFARNSVLVSVASTAAAARHRLDGGLRLRPHRVPRPQLPVRARTSPR